MMKEDSWWWMKMVMINIDENYPIWQANEAKIKIPKNPEIFFLNPGTKNIGKSCPEKSRDPGIWQNPGIEILDPVRAWPGLGGGGQPNFGNTRILGAYGLVLKTLKKLSSERVPSECSQSRYIADIFQKDIFRIYLNQSWYIADISQM